MRGLLILAVLAVLMVTVWPLVRSALARMGGPPAVKGAGAHDELVKDPVCQTYVVRSRAIRNESGGRSVYFCSSRCAEQFRERERSA
jgi:YHS domain-containing protein